MISWRRVAVGAGLLALALVPPLAAWLDASFYVVLFTRIVIFAIAAVSLDLILGYGGMVSFGHAAYLGIGSYAMGILSTYGITNGFVHFGVAIGASAAIALLIGFVSLRTSGVHFIMITLAFSQMIYFLCESLNQFGGDNGLNIPDHSSFGGLIDLDDAVTLYYLAFGCLLVCLWFGSRLVESRFGMVVRRREIKRSADGSTGLFDVPLSADRVRAGRGDGRAGRCIAGEPDAVPVTLHHALDTVRRDHDDGDPGRHGDTVWTGRRRGRLSGTGERAVRIDQSLAGNTGAGAGGDCAVPQGRNSGSKPACLMCCWQRTVC